LKAIRLSTGSQSNSFNTGVTGSCLLVRVISLAALLQPGINCNLTSKRLDLLVVVKHSYHESTCLSVELRIVALVNQHLPKFFGGDLS